MQTSRHFHMELRHATMPTYVFSYLFPLVLLAYELWRVGSASPLCFSLRNLVSGPARISEKPWR